MLCSCYFIVNFIDIFFRVKLAMSLSQLASSIRQPPSQAEVTPAISSLRSHVKGKAGSEDGSRPLVSVTDESGQSFPISYDDIYQCMEESEDAQEVISEAVNDECLWQQFCGLPAVSNVIRKRIEGGFNRAKTVIVRNMSIDNSHDNLPSNSDSLNGAKTVLVRNMSINNSHDNPPSNSEKPKLWWERILSTLSGMGEAIWKFMKRMFGGIHSGIKGAIEVMKDSGHPTIEVMKDSGHQLKSLFVSFFTSIVVMFGVLLDRLAKQAMMI
ncbi:hypothetical protein LOK49_LG02G00745 [Camellia lanceoleosa]|uniref:Uncharacterized protein n=1 Tax=Camellia lanceoleosa TaxID=1840588 RepID=A0ACC0IKJ1_9ERIC|nr:hypothetical protein LOK49_LG02G00745 [Camellia lanceoleosa]